MGHMSSFSIVVDEDAAAGTEGGEDIKMKVASLYTR